MSQLGSLSPSTELRRMAVSSSQSSVPDQPALPDTDPVTLECQSSCPMSRLSLCLPWYRCRANCGVTKRRGSNQAVLCGFPSPRQCESQLLELLWAPAHSRTPCLVEQGQLACQSTGSLHLQCLFRLLNYPLTLLLREMLWDVIITTDTLLAGRSDRFSWSATILLL